MKFPVWTYTSYQLSQKALSTDELRSLQLVYTQLYPDHQIEHISHFYLRANKAVIADEIVGSACSRSKKASVIGAYWPSNGSSLSTIDYSKLNIGVIQYFLKHTMSMKDKCGRTKDFHHILCDVKWFISHPESHWFGTSTVIAHAFEKSHTFHACTTYSLPMCPCYNGLRLTSWKWTSVCCYTHCKKFSLLKCASTQIVMVVFVGLSCTCMVFNTSIVVLSKLERILDPCL